MKTLDPFSGSWSDQNLRTLLNRTMFGYTKSQWNAWADQSSQDLINKLLVAKPIPDPPVNKDFEDDPYAKVGETWVDKPYPRRNKDAVQMRRVSLISWVISEIIENKTSIYPKMILFWHNHFPIEKINDLRFDYDYYNLIHKHALGNFKQLTLEMTLQPAMLRYLNGNQNTAKNPNENFAANCWNCSPSAKVN